MIRDGRIWAAKLAAGALLASLPALAEGPPVYAGATSVRVTYANADSNRKLAQSPTVKLGFVGYRQGMVAGTFVMDTGSTGIIASPDLFRPAPDARNLGPGRQIYSSSGVVENGTWWSATENIYDADGRLLAQAEVPVLQVTSVACRPQARSCRPTQHPRHVAMLGVGFARESRDQERGTPDYNAFINLSAIAGPDGHLHPLPRDWRNGYVVTPAGVELGLTAADTAGAAFAKLEPNPEFSRPGLPEWQPATIVLTVNGVAGKGRVLMDTGVGTAYLSPPPGAPVGTLGPCARTGLAKCLAPGSTVALSLPGEPDPKAHYGFSVGANDNPMQPEEVVVVHDSGVFLNTSRHVLGGMNVIFDEAEGYVGYQWNGGTGPQIGFVRP
jgi:hypothetical protein